MKRFFNLNLRSGPGFCVCSKLVHAAAPPEYHRTVGQNDSPAEPDGFTLRPGIDVSSHFLAGNERSPAVARAGQSAYVAVFDSPRDDVAVLVFDIDQDGRMRVSPDKLPDRTLQRDLGIGVIRGAPAMMCKDFSVSGPQADREHGPGEKRDRLHR